MKDAAAETKLVKQGPQPAAIERTQEVTELTPTSLEAEQKYSLQASAGLARQNPRDEMNAWNKLLKACEREGFAEDALYVFPRGGKSIEGPSVNLAREAARLWGNIWVIAPLIVTDTAEERKIRVLVWDLETNQRREAEDCFAKLIQRKAEGEDGKKITRWVVPDERDLRELTNRRAAILERNCILHLLPHDMVEGSVEQVKRTLRKAATGNKPETQGSVTNGTPTPVGAKAEPTKVAKLLEGFGQLKVLPSMIEKYLGHPIEALTAMEYQVMVGIGKTMRDTGASWESITGQKESDGDAVTEREAPLFEGE